MSLKEKLGELEDSLVTVEYCAPDDYDEWLLKYFPTQAAIHEERIKDLRELWSEIRPKIKKDLVKADYVGVKLQEMMDAFDKGDKGEGQKIAGELADLYDITKLK
ncbi:hypothetical protein HUN23_18325 [Acinetobacter oleivorans]|uniref:hypothetical protein n=1 Tax=Acinetobacter oleivorans TaxID=1148157 RepID=UPI00157FD547|nr:hypothetical protein [Acinetobacter oleivorans]NUF24712.1 hypothetical protein [Acinetobacter oleivorans]